MNAAKLVTIVILFINMAESDGLYTDADNVQYCRQFTADIEIKDLIDSRRQSARKCACFEQQIQLDYSFEKQENNCYQEWLYDELGSKQMCCYGNNGQLLVGAPGGGYLVMTSEKTNTSHIHTSCCQKGGRYSRELCEQFYSINPSDDCSSYLIPHSVMSWGDPSIQTLDGNIYDFNGHGEYIFLNTSDVEVQVRLDYVNPPQVDATMFTEVVIFVNKSYPLTEMHYKKTSKDIDVYQNGQFLCNASRTTLSGRPFPCKNPPDKTCMVLSGYGIVSVQGCGLKNVANYIEFSSGEFMSIKIFPLKSINGSVGGLAGKQDGGKLVCRDRISVKINGTAPEIFNCSETWRLKNESESHFNYTLTGGNFTVYNTFSKPRFLEEIVDNLTALFANYTSEQISLYSNTCRNYWDQTSNKECLLTIARTGSYDLGLAIMEKVNETRRQYNILYNPAPKFNVSTPSVITVSYKKNKTWTLDLNLYVRHNVPLKFSVVTQLPKEEYNLTDGIFIWTIGVGLRNKSSTSIIFVATDEYNKTDNKEVKVTYCGCEDPSECYFNSTNPQSADQMFIVPCTCKEYYSGTFCTKFEDPCNTTECFNPSLCNANRSKPPGDLDWPCSECPKGYRGTITLNKQYCTDINECTDEYAGPRKCSQPKNCNNTEGSFVCFCDTGYTLDKGDNITCNDIDECRSSPCPENRICTNTDGNYTCDCEPGFVFERNDCVKIKGYRFVGMIDFEISPITTNTDNIDNEKSKTNIAHILLQAFNNTADFITVQVYSLSISASTVIHQPSLLRAKIIVHWTNNSSATIQSSLPSSLRRNLVTPFNLQSLEIQSIQNFTIFTPNVFGLCDVPGETDCDLPTTECVNKIDLKGFECRCKSGYMLPKRSNINTPYCIDINECEWENIAELCLNGFCSNTIGSWSCQCPNRRYPTSKDLSTNTTRKFRCVGDFRYIGQIQLFWLHTVVNESQIHQLFNEKITNLFRTSNIAAIEDYPMSDIFRSIEILTIDISRMSVGSNINVTYLLRIGEQTTAVILQSIQKLIFGNELKHSGTNDTITVEHSQIFDESQHNLCDDTKRIECDLTTTFCSVLNGSYSCPCKEGYTNTSDPFTCQDIDECKTGKGNCSDGGTCRNTPGNWTCDCPTGFGPNFHDMNLVICEDIDECLHNTTYICDGGHCNDTNGSWNCICPPGYNTATLKPGYIYRCTDVDECDDGAHTTCSNGGTCVNSLGNWTCNCAAGFEVHYINETYIDCADIDECNQINTYSCTGKNNSSSCVNTVGSWECNCTNGYYPRDISPFNKTCEDINECASIGCIGGTCQNTDGSFICHCETGFENELQNGHQVCKDIDECKTGQGKCYSGGNCSNIPGNWTCDCPTGHKPTFFHDNNITCEDVDECRHTDAYICNGGHCNNTIGGWNCSCLPGYYSKEIKKDTVYTCTDINECSGGAICANGGTCANTPGNWTCECSSGFRAKNVNSTFINCTDIDECINNETYICTSGICDNYNGGWNCNCPTGYKLTELQRDRVYTCTDIDECESGTVSPCSNGGTCINYPGNWTCTCKDGFEAKYINNTYIDCKDIDECTQNAQACIGGFCKNTVGAWQCLCVAGKKETIVNKTTKTCSGVYVYAVTLEFQTVTLNNGNIDENDPRLTKYFEEQILQAYHTSFSQSTVKVNILKIKRSHRQERATEVSRWNVDFVAEFDKQLEQNDVVSALTNHSETCLLTKCQINSELPFKIEILNAKLEPDPASVLCDHYRNCDEETTHCEYVNHTTLCTCKNGYEPKDNTYTKCQVKKDVCIISVCDHGGICVQPENSGSFKCICQKEWTGEYCNIAQTLVSDSGSDQTNTTLIAVGGSLGGIVIILLVTIFVVCKWRGRKVKEAEKIALKNVDNNGFKPFDGSLYDDRHIGDSQQNSLERKSLNSFRVPRPNETPVQNGYRLSAANLYATPHKLHRQTIHGSMIDLTNGHADHFHDEPRRLSVQDPQRHIASNMGWSYTANITRPVSLNGDILRKHPQPDYDRPPSPQPDYHRNERFDAARDSGMGVGYNRNGSLSNEYRRSDPLKRNSYDGPNGETRF